MTSLFKKLRLYRVITVLKYLVSSWHNSRIIKNLSPSINKNRLSIYFSLLYWYYFYGFNLTNYISFKFWEKDSKTKKSYISYRKNYVLGLKFSNSAAYALLLDKASFNKKYKNFIKRDWLDCRECSKEDIFSFFKKHTDIILKPLHDYGGHGVKNYYNLTDTEISKIIDEIYNKDFIIEEKIENIEELKRLAPNSLNTIRIVTVIDKNKKLHILATLLRIGNGKEIADNFYSGGLACAIDLNTGCLKKVAYDKSFNEYTHHPYSKIKFEGYEISGFKDIIKFTEDLSSVEPNARYVGWDIAVTNNGLEVLEGNIPPDETITQLAVGKGLWHEINSLK